MASDDTILNEIKHLRNDFNRVDSRLGAIEEAIKEMAVQANQINTLDRDVSALWQAKANCDTDLTAIKQFQAACPRGEHQRIFYWMWGVIGLHSTALLFIIGMMLKTAGGG